MKKKLKSQRGFTLLEVLCAFLVIALSAGLFAAGLGAAVRINFQADEQRTAFFEELSRVDSWKPTPSSPGETKKLIIKDATNVTAPPIKLDIQVYAGNSTGGGLVYYVLS